MRNDSELYWLVAEREEKTSCAGRMRFERKRVPLERYRHPLTRYYQDNFDFSARAQQPR